MSTPTSIPAGTVVMLPCGQRVMLMHATLVDEVSDRMTASSFFLPAVATQPHTTRLLAIERLP